MRWLPDLPNKEEMVSLVMPEVPKQTCRVCNRELERHQIVYQGDVCWDCFKRTVIAIAKNQETLEDTEIVLELLYIASKYYGRD